MRFIIFSSMSILVCAIATASTIDCRTIGIQDGDTLSCLTAEKKQLKVRLSEIDAPEKYQAFGQKSKQALSALTWGKHLTIVSNGTDRYLRILGTVFVNGKNINEEMVRLGYAWAYRQYLTPSSKTKYLMLEATARGKKYGLWADQNPIRPSEFRSK